MIRALSLQRIQILLFLPAVLLTLISLVTLYAVDFASFEHQIIFFVAGIGVYIFFLNIDYRLFGIFAKQIYFFILFLLAIIFVIGFEAKGAVRWIEVFGVSLQFSELLKPFFIIIFAHFLTKNDKHDLKTFLKALLILFPVFFLVLRQPDLGNAIIYAFVAVSMMFTYGFPIRYFVTLGIFTLLPLPLFFNFLHDYQKLRVYSFFNATSDPFGSSYNSIQALISVGSGGVFGKGLGEGTQSVLRFLPERHTDFIFATIVESLGIFGAVIIMSLFIFLLFQIFKISLLAKDNFSYLIVIGMFFLILTHVFFNIGMNVGILPIVGITLPYVSAGGSSLITNFVALSFLSSISYDQKRKKLMEIS